jgi:Protein of unknown function (DUF2442)
MEHKLDWVTSFKVLRSYALEIQFDDGISQIVNFDGVLEGELYGPLKDPNLFKSVKLDHELGNLVWPNGADFDPEILHDWPQRRQSMIEAAAEWRKSGGTGTAEAGISSHIPRELDIDWQRSLARASQDTCNFVGRR